MKVVNCYGVKAKGEGQAFAKEKETKTWESKGERVAG
jgi:hypothetical protein